MTKNLPLCLEIYCKGGFDSVPDKKSHVLTYEILLNSLTQVCDHFVFSLRHLYDPLDNQRLRSFILINLASEVDNPETFEIIEGLLKGSLSRFYDFTYQSQGFPQLNWVNSIGEIFKCGEFVEQPEFIGYLPHFFYTELVDEKFNLLELLEAAKCKKLVLEFSLEAYNSPNEQACWRNAIEDLVSRLSNCASKGSSIKYALELYRNYQDNYTENQLFKYSVKALGCNAVDTVAILQTLAGVVGKANTRQKINPILTFGFNDSNFKGSLEATQNIRIFQGVKWNGWEKIIGKTLEKKLIKETVKSGGLLSSFDDGSLNFPILPSNLEQFNQSQKINHALPGSSELILDPDSSDLALGGSTSLSRIFDMQIPKVEHLKPLHHITTFQEIVGFIKIFQPLVKILKEGIKPEVSGTNQHDLTHILYIKDLIKKYQSEITEDTYIVGIDSNGALCISNWEKSPHRLIAGTPGAGKTNFLFSLLYQLLYANPDSKIFLADFQAGLHFHIIASQYKNVEMVTQLESFARLLKNLVDEHELRREVMISNRSRSRLQLQQKSGIKLARNFLIIDEAFFIQNADKVTKSEIEKHLTTLASQSRVTGIHIIYCSQSPNLLNKQIKACIEERVVLRVANNNESFGLLDNLSALGLEQGMAVYRGISYDPKSPKIVKVPYVPDEVWDSPIC
jgi:hypothetical protein